MEKKVFETVEEYQKECERLRKEVCRLSIEPFYSLEFQYLVECFPGFSKVIRSEFHESSGVLPYDHGFVYALWAKETTIVKIGKSINPNRRLTEISPKSMYEIVLVRAWKTPFMSKAERLLHKIYGDYRMNGEWFDLGAEQHNTLFATPLEQLLDYETSYTARSAYWIELLTKYKDLYPDEYDAFIDQHQDAEDVSLGHIFYSYLDSIFCELSDYYFHHKKLDSIANPRVNHGRLVQEFGGAS